MAWWVIEDKALRAALDRVARGEEPGLVEAELYANSAVDQIEPE
jgi:hypothetical protein